jgi:hypothetical protein
MSLRHLRCERRSAAGSVRVHAEPLGQEMNEDMVNLVLDIQ